MITTNQKHFEKLFIKYNNEDIVFINSYIPCIRKTENTIENERQIPTAIIYRFQISNLTVPK